jgi:hypothetical protein
MISMFPLQHDTIKTSSCIHVILCEMHSLLETTSLGSLAPSIPKDLESGDIGTPLSRKHLPG